jgi:polyisoprenoid-binding protein YceI
MAQAAEQLERVPLPPVGRYDLDPAHTSVEFVARHMLSKVRGRFGEFTGSVEVTGDGKAKVEAQIQAASISTNQDMRDGHLKSPDFLDVEKHPTLEFRSYGFRRTGETTFELDGELTIRDVTKPVTLKGEFLGWGPDMQGTPMLAASARTTIDREDFGITWNTVVETGGLLVGKKVDIELDAEAKLVS